MEKILSRYIGKEIGISFRSGSVDTATLKSVSSGFIVIRSKETIQHIPFHSVIRFIESEDEAFLLISKHIHALTIVVKRAIGVISTWL